MTITRIHHDAKEGTSLVHDQAVGVAYGHPIFRATQGNSCLTLSFATLDHQWEVILTENEVQQALAALGVQQTPAPANPIRA